MNDKKIAILGGGNLGTAIAEGLLASGLVQADQLHVTRNKVERLADLAARGVHISSRNDIATAQADIVIIAVKPYKINDVLTEIRAELREDRHTLVSVVTGVSIQEMVEQLGGMQLPIVRAMPNTAIAIRESMTCLCAQNIDKEALQTIVQLFDTLGTTLVIQEELMEASTVLGACGIAYVLRFIRAMVQGGIEIGFDAKTASIIANQTVKGAAELLIRNGQHPESEIDKVTTPKGCTIAGLNEMEHIGFSSSLIKGILTSFRKIEK